MPRRDPTFSHKLSEPTNEGKNESVHLHFNIEYYWDLLGIIHR